MIRVLLADDHRMFREALRMMLAHEAGMVVVAEAGDGDTALRMVEQFAPDVAVLDITLPGESGIEVTRRLLAKYPQLKVLALSSHLERSTIQLMLDAGAHGYVAKAAASVELAQGIRSVCEGKSFLCPEVAAVMADSLRRPQRGTGKSGDTRPSRRELQVITLLAKGKTAPEIAAELHVSTATVVTHRRNIMKKLDLHKAADITRYAMRTGLIS